MHIQFVSKGIDVSPALRERIEGKVEEGTAKYFSRPGEAFITATKEGFGFKVECSLHLPSGAFLQASGEGTDAYAAAEIAVEHLEKRLRRYKRRLKDHHNENKAGLPAEETPIVVFRGNGRAVVLDEDEDDGDDGGATGGSEPVIVAETVGELRTLTVSMAVHEMDVLDAPFILFRNAASGSLNVVYRRPDGHVGWIDPAREVKDGAAR
ncbi:MAG: ribosome-associated translation inhibitor RaiA [Oceanicaulis sp.]|uniref:ribosome hibernation-promoting factor, HPF/YfiA family n=1 Tax=Glycocaulis sp. TaxID=1969725 RepID=UPI0025BCCFBE|nr:ribosome-associated translation inhibitor RaiA [Glycocaulis sp.]MCC5981925.1 ribosome-associated translation inhibitor RaiA [Oceanicaulis sp.]MCH8520886.1 ribosome-associated translation inhibitor RaiA [Glycocaulis sp.]